MRREPGAVLRAFVTWITVFGMMVFAASLLSYIGYHAVCPGPVVGWLPTLVAEHYPAIIGIPTCAIAAFCIVTLLKVAHGPIELEVRGITFRGASVPLFFWTLCFATMVWAGHLVWEGRRSGKTAPVQPEVQAPTSDEQSASGAASTSSWRARMCATFR